MLGPAGHRDLEAIREVGLEIHVGAANVTAQRTGIGRREPAEALRSRRRDLAGVRSVENGDAAIGPRAVIALKDFIALVPVGEAGRDTQGIDQSRKPERPRPFQVYVRLCVEQVSRVERRGAIETETGVVRVVDDARDTVAPIGSAEIELSERRSAELQASGYGSIARFDVEEGLKSIGEKPADCLIRVRLAQVTEAGILPPPVGCEPVQRRPVDGAFGIDDEVVALRPAAAVEPIAVWISCFARIAAEIHLPRIGC